MFTTGIPMTFIVTGRQPKLLDGNVFSRVGLSVILSGGGVGVPHCAGPAHPTPLVTSGSQDWIFVQTCSLDDLTLQAPTGAHIWWLPAYGGPVVRILLESYCTFYRFTLVCTYLLGH